MESRRHGILVGYDGSDDADAAVGWAAEAAVLRREPVVVVIAEDTGADAGGVPWWPESHWRELGEKAQARLHEAGVGEVRIERHAGSLVPVLVPLATDATMLVLGSRGRARAGQSFVGSSSTHAAGHAPCPVVVVREAETPGSDRVVVGLDGSPGSTAALAFACEQAALTGCRVVALHGSGGDGGSGGSGGSAVAHAVARAAAGHPGVRLETEEVDGPAAAALVEASGTAALVVVGSRGLRPDEGARLGSVSHEVLRHARCPVAVVR